MMRSILCLLLAMPAFSGQLPDSEHIYVTGQAMLNAVPDMATIELQIAQTDLDTAKAKADVDERCAKVIAAAREAGCGKEDITASQMAMNPDYEWGNSSGHVYKGTKIMRDISIVLRDLSRFGSIIQKLAEVPITELRLVTMGSSKMKDLKEQALAKAVDDAKSKAKKIGAMFGVEIGDVFSISETDLADNKQFALGNINFDSASENKSVFEPGNIHISSHIYVVFRLKVKK